jgi:iron-sulfur cluster repair protein YtfE (RIC family)
MKNFKEFKMREIVSKDLRAMDVFKKLGIDYDNCKEKTLQEVCGRKHINPEMVLDYMADAIVQDLS